MTWKWRPPLASTFADLQTHAFNIATFGGRTRMSHRRGENVEVQYRDGTLWTPKDYEENELELAMWVVGADPVTGKVPADPSDRFWQNVHALRRLFRTDLSLGELRQLHPVADVEIAAEAEVKESIDFETMAGATRAAFFARFTLPKVWFRTLLNTGEQEYTSRSHDEEWVVSVDSDVMIKDAVIWIRDPSGGAANVRIYNESFGSEDHWMMYADVLGAGEEVQIEVGKWRATRDGVTRVTGNVQWSGQPQFFWLVPGDNDLRLEVTDGPVEIRVEAKGAYW